MLAVAVVVALAVVAVGSALVLVPGSCPVVALAAAVLLVVLVLLLLSFWLTVSSAINNLQFLSDQPFASAQPSTSPRN